MIRVHKVANPFIASGRESVIVVTRFARVRALAPRDWEDSPDLVAYRNGSPCELDDLAFSGDHVTFALAPRGTEFLVNLALLVVFSALSYALRPRLKRPTNPEDTASPLYSFDGITSSRTEGLPIPRYFGATRAGGQIIREFTEDRGALGSWYNVVICFGYGPVQSIAGITTDTLAAQPLRTNGPSGFELPEGIFINETDATQYRDVEAHIRLGTVEQESIPGFNEDITTVGLTRDLDAPETTSVVFNPFVSTTTPSTSEDSLWDEYGQFYDTDQEVDSVTVKLRFPQGIGFQDPSSGSWFNLAFSLAVRYRELDGSGLPITTGGLAGDGYVRLRPTRRWYAALQGDSRVDYTFRLFDPQTFTLPTQSGALKCKPNEASGGTDTSAFAGMAGSSITSGTYPSGWDVLTGVVQEVTAAAWVAIRPNGTSFGYSQSDVGPQHLTTSAPVLSWLNESTLRGFELLLQTKDFQPEPGQIRKRVVAIARLGNGTTIREFYVHNPLGGTSPTPGEIGDVPIPINVNQRDDPDNSAWYHVAFAYKRTASGTNDRLRVFVNGEIALEVYASIGLRVPITSAPADLRVGSDMRNTGTTNASHCFRGWMAEVGVWPRELAPAEIEARYNDNLGRYETNASSTWVYYHFGDNYPTGVSGNGATVADSGPRAFNLTISLPGGIGTPTNTSSMFSSGVVKTFIDRDLGTNTPKRSRYRVEVMRATRDYTPADGVDEVQWEAIQLRVDQQFRHPECALLALRIKAQDQLSGQAPRISAKGEWSLVRVWDGADVNNPSLSLRYSRNPAWIAYDLLTNPRSGMGAYVRDADVDLVSLKAWADRNDEWVYDLRGNVLEIHGTDTSKAISSLGYNSNGVSVTAFIVTLRSPYIGNIPANYKVGAFIGFHGLETPDTNANVHLDMNLEAHGGWKIIAVDDGVASGTARLFLDYDVGVLPPLPWTIGGSPTGSMATAISPTALTGSMNGVEVRNRFDGGYDEAENGWDALIALCDTAGATPLRSGSKIHFAIDGPKDPVDMVTIANIQQGSFEMEYVQARAKPNAMDVEILDEELNFERATVHDEHPSVTGTASLSEIRTGQVRLKGVTRRSQAKRWARETLNQNVLLRRAGRYVASIDALPHEANEVLLVSHDIIPGRGKGGRVLEGSTDTDLKLDRAITLESGTTYKVGVRSAVAPAVEGFETRTVSSGAGTYSGVEGDSITVSVAFSFTPQPEDVFVLYEDGQQLPIRIRSIGFERDLRRTVSWIEDSDDVWIVDGTELDDLDASTTSTQAQALTFADSGDSGQLPDRVEALAVSTEITRIAGGTHAYGLRLTWQPVANRAISEQVLWMATVRGSWVEVGRVGPGVSSALVPLQRVQPGTGLAVAVQPVTRSGARRDVEACGVRTARVFGVPPAPQAPTDLQSGLVGGRATYGWSLPAGTDAAAIEMRRGGWILGQPVFTDAAGSGSYGPTADWVTIPATNSIDGGGLGALLVARAKNSHGAWSSTAQMRALHVPIDSTSLADVRAAILHSQEWRDFGDGWIDDAAPAQNSTLTNLQRDAAGDLVFDGSDLTATFETAEPELLAIAVPEDVYVSAYVEARQIHPLTWEQMNWSWGDPAASQWTWEGPLNDVGDGLDARCTLAIEARFRQRNGSWGAWSSYKPGRVLCLGVQFRLIVTRPTSAFDVRIRRFGTNLTRAATTKFDRDDHNLFMHGNVFHDG